MNEIRWGHNEKDFFFQIAPPGRTGHKKVNSLTPGGGAYWVRGANEFITPVSGKERLLRMWSFNGTKIFIKVFIMTN